MKTLTKLEEYKDTMSRLSRVTKCSECPSFADLCWDEVDPFALNENPGALFETDNRVFVLQEINDEIRYYAGGWKTEESKQNEPYEFGVFKDLADALAFAVDFLVNATAIDQIQIPRDRHGGTHRSNSGR